MSAQAPSQREGVRLLKPEVLAGLANLVVFIWFTVKGVFGLIALLDGRPR